jgi:hypothetical protein
MTIDIVVLVVPCGVLLPILLYQGGEVIRKVTESVITYPSYDSISSCIYFYKYNYLHLGGARHGPLIFLDGGLSHSEPLLGSSGFVQGGTPGINPRHIHMSSISRRETPPGDPPPLALPTALTMPHHLTTPPPTVVPTVAPKSLCCRQCNPHRPL